MDCSTRKRDNEMADTKTQFHIAIVGAGLGGLAAAISIAQGGHKATIFEQAAELGEVSLASISQLLYFSTY
jgi:2-polyprenyl-6-methoxyphenol hydroxylase-like FAD-dependent oxidoreductase